MTAMTTPEPAQTRISLDDCVTALPEGNEGKAFEVDDVLRGYVLRGYLFTLSEFQVRVIVVFSFMRNWMLGFNPGDAVHVKGAAEVLDAQRLDLRRWGSLPALLIRDPEVHATVSGSGLHLYCTHCEKRLHERPEGFVWWVSERGIENCR